MLASQGSPTVLAATADGDAAPLACLASWGLPATLAALAPSACLALRGSPAALAATADAATRRPQPASPCRPRLPRSPPQTMASVFSASQVGLRVGRSIRNIDSALVREVDVVLDRSWNLYVVRAGPLASGVRYLAS